MGSDVTTDRSPLDAWEQVVTREAEDSARLRERIAAQLPAPGVELWIARHGETTANAAGLVTGTFDAPLNVSGRLQAQEAGRAIAGLAFELGFASNLERSRESLALMIRAGRLRVAATADDARLAERSLGELERTAIRPRDPRLAVDLTIAPTGGESYLSLTRRCLSFLLDVRTLAARLGRPLSLLLCTHQGPMRVLVGILDEVADPAAVRESRYENGDVVRRSLGPLVWPAFAGGLPAKLAFDQEDPRT